jgi:hypothetical protein
LAHFLKPSGALIVIDNMETAAPIDHAHLRDTSSHHKHGFDESVIEKIFGGAGLISITYGKISPVQKHFIAKGIKSAV